MLLITSLLTISCKNNTKYLVCGNVKYIEKFNVERQLAQGTDVSNAFDLKGCVGVRTVDSLAIFYYYDADYCWKIYNLKTRKLLASLFPKGHGPGEAVKIIVPGIMYNQNGITYVQYTSNEDNCLRIVNLKASISQRKIIVSYEKHFNNKDFLQEAAMFKDSTYIVFSDSEDQTQRNYIVSDSVCNLKWVTPLNIKAEDLGVLSFIQRVNYDNWEVAEAMLYLNQINLYSVRNEKALTLCIGNKLSDIEVVNNKSTQNRIRYFNSLSSYHQYFITTYINTTRKNYDSNKGNTSIMFISWEGEPLKKFNINYIADAVFVYNNLMYVFSRHMINEKMICYSI